MHRRLKFHIGGQVGYAGKSVGYVSCDSVNESTFIAVRFPRLLISESLGLEWEPSVTWRSLKRASGGEESHLMNSL